jgi:hypothetical protein
MLREHALHSSPVTACELYDELIPVACVMFCLTPVAAAATPLPPYIMMRYLVKYSGVTWPRLRRIELATTGTLSTERN